MGIHQKLCIAILPLLIACSSGERVARQPIIQSGSVTIPQDSRPTDDPWTLVYDTKVIFPRQFVSVPKVHLSLSAIEAYSRREGAFYRLEAEAITQTEFQLKVYAAYMNSFSNCTISWIAISEP
jgi:hypothetical protein